MSRKSSRFTIMTRLGIGFVVTACVAITILPAVSLFQARTADTQSFWDAPEAEEVAKHLASESKADVRSAVSVIMVHRALLSHECVMRASIVALQRAGVRIDDANLQVLANVMAHKGPRFVDAAKAWSCDELESGDDLVVSHMLHLAISRAVRNYQGGVIPGYEDVERAASQEVLLLSDLCS